MPGPLGVEWDPEAPPKSFDVPWNAETEAPKGPPVGNAGKALIGAGIGAGAGMGGAALVATLRRLFPGMSLTKNQLDINALKRLNDAVRKNDSTTNISKELLKYEQFVKESGRNDVTPMQWFSLKGDSNIDSAILQMNAHSGKAADVKDALTNATFDQQGRVLSSLARAMGIQERSLPKTLEELNAARRANAAPLYEEAFRDKKPLIDSRLYDFLEQHRPLMSEALQNAAEAFKFDPDKAIGTQMVKVVTGPRKDSWKWTNTENVPEYLRFGEARNGLQSAISPNMETLDRMKRALWALAQKRGKDGAGDVGAIHDVRRQFTSLLDEIGPDAYKKARLQARTDIEASEAAELGARLLRMSPDEVLATMSKMSPHEREAAMYGFYGSARDMDSAKLIRDYVTKAERHPQARQALSTVVKDPTAFASFLRELDAEAAISKGVKYGDPPATLDTGVTPSLVGGTLAPKQEVLRLSHRLAGWPSNRASRAGTDLLMTPYSWNPPGHAETAYERMMRLSGDVPTTWVTDYLKRPLKAAGWGAGAGALGSIPWMESDAPKGGLRQLSPEPPPLY